MKYLELFEQIANVRKTTKPKHIVKAIRSPLHALKAFKYHYRRVSERAFTEFLAKQWGCSDKDIDTAYEDLDHNSLLWEEVKKKLSIHPNSYGLQMTKELSALYLIVRLIQPDCIIETGVSAGASSTYILRALQDNKKGTLYSIDLPPDNLPKGKTCGWTVPNSLRSRWRLNIGNTKDLLEPLLNDLGKIDCFIHDSLHTYDHMIWEFRKVWPRLSPGGLFLAHDIGRNKAFFDLTKEVGISWREWRVFHVLGGFRKPL